MSITIVIYGGRSIWPRGDSRREVIESRREREMRRAREAFERVDRMGGVWGCAHPADRIRG